MNNDNTTKLHGCIGIDAQLRNFDNQKSNLLNNQNTTISLKALAKQYLERNWYCNHNATKDKNRCNFSSQSLDKSCSSKYGISLQVIKEFLNEDWADLLSKNQLIKQGITPDNFTAITHCNGCGDVYVPPALVKAVAY